jgi:HAD superfamily hydrolase (TIGR01509 family)
MEAHMTIKLVIFDCDGVLVDSEPATNRVIADDLFKRGLTLTEAYVAKYFVGGTMKGVEDKAKKMGADLPHDWLDVIYEKMFAALRQGVRLFPDVVLFLDALDDQGVSYAIVSNGPTPTMDITLTPSGLNTRFAGRIYSGHDHPPKPAPDMIQRAMLAADVSAAETVFIDDSANGASAGIAAGVRTFGFDPSGHFTHLDGLAVDKVRSMRDIADIIGVSMPAIPTKPKPPENACPGCGVMQRYSARYPWHFCNDCRKSAVDKRGRQITCFNTHASGGFGFSVAGFRGRYTCSGIIATIKNRPVLIKEAYMGGVVAQPWMNNPRIDIPKRVYSFIRPQMTKGVIKRMKERSRPGR